MGFTDAVRNFLSSATGPGVSPGPVRVSGPPTSSNGASSLHLAWEVAPVPLREVAVTIEVMDPPTVDELYFWALQVNFTSQGFPAGGAHVGLQHHPNYPDSGAVNWGGYGDDGQELAGSASSLPSALDNPNTRTYRWYPQRRYRYRVFPSPERGWRASITDLDGGQDPGGHEVIIRDLHVEADALAAPMVWSEVFAHCDHPSTAVRWSDCTAHSVDGKVLRPRAVRLNYQDYGQGGCTNTNSALETAADGTMSVTQRTNAVRANRSGTVLRLAQR
jgi:hypothetical protein